MEGLQSLLVLFPETTSSLWCHNDELLVTPTGSWVQDLVCHSPYKADHHSGLLVPLGVMG